MRILLWSPNGSGLHYGGAGTNAYRLYSSSRDPELKVTLVCATKAQESYPVFSEIVNLHPQNSQTFWDHVIFLRKARKWLRENARFYDVFHGMGAFEHTIRPAVWAEEFGLPAVVKPASHGSGLSSSRGLRRLLRLPERRRELLKRLSGVVSISSAIHDELTGYGITRIHDIPNGVDVQKFRPGNEDERRSLRRSFGWKDDAFIVLFVGALGSRKRPHWLIEALAPVMQQHPELRLVFVGPERESGYLQKLQEMIKAEGLKERITLTGLQPNVEDYYRAADVYCLPSANEGMPNSVLEAMASGLPSIVTKISGSEDLIEAGIDGSFIQNADSIRVQVLEYMDRRDKVIQQGAAARHKVLSRYSCEAVLDAHLRVFRHLAQARSS